MTNEIKEILDLFYNEYPKEEKILEKYISDLQEENKIYKKIYNELLKQANKDSIWCKIILDKLQELKEENKL